MLRALAIGPLTPDSCLLSSNSPITSLFSMVATREFLARITAPQGVGPLTPDSLKYKLIPHSMHRLDVLRLRGVLLELGA